MGFKLLNSFENGAIYVAIKTISPKRKTFKVGTQYIWTSSNMICLCSRGTKVEKMLTLAPERYTAEFCMVAKVILWCI